MATIAVCGFECGFAGGVANHHFNNSGTTALDTGTVHPGGTTSIKVTCNGSAASAQGMFNAPAGAAVRVGSFFINVASLPAANAEFFRLNSTTARNVMVGFEQSSGKLCVYAGTNFAGRVVGPVLVAGAWTRIDFKADGTGLTLDWRVDGAVQTQLAIGGSTGTFSWYLMGHNLSVDVAFTAYTAYYDDVAMSATAGDYPLLTDFIIGYVPASDGTHNTGTAGNFTDGTSNITNSTTTAWQLLDEKPPTTTDKVVQALDTSGALYVEVRFNTTAVDRTPLALDFTTVWRAATAASAAGQIKMRDNLGTTDDAIVNTTVAVTSDTYFTKHYAARPAALGAWTMEAFQDIRARFGFGTDVTPDIWFGGIVAEAAFAVAPHETVLVKRNHYRPLLPQ